MVDQYVWHRGEQFNESDLSQGVNYLLNIVSFVCIKPPSSAVPE